MGFCIHLSWGGGGGGMEIWETVLGVGPRSLKWQGACEGRGNGRLGTRLSAAVGRPESGGRAEVRVGRGSGVAGGGQALREHMQVASYFVSSAEFQALRTKKLDAVAINERQKLWLKRSGDAHSAGWQPLPAPTNRPRTTKRKQRRYVFAPSCDA